MKIEKADPTTRWDVWFIINDYGEDLAVEERELEELCDLLLKRRAEIREKQQKNLADQFFGDLERVFNR